MDIGLSYNQHVFPEFRLIAFKKRNSICLLPQYDPDLVPVPDRFKAILNAVSQETQSSCPVEWIAEMTIFGC